MTDDNFIDDSIYHDDSNEDLEYEDPDVRSRHTQRRKAKRTLDESDDDGGCIVDDDNVEGGNRMDFVLRLVLIPQWTANS